MFPLRSSCKILIKCIFCNFIFWMTHCLGCQGRLLIHTPLHTPGNNTVYISSPALKTCVIYYTACTVNTGFPSPFNATLKYRGVGTFTTLAIWTHYDAVVTQTTSGRLLLHTETPPWNGTKVHNCSLCEPWWSWWDFAIQPLAFDIL